MNKEQTEACEALAKIHDVNFVLNKNFKSLTASAGFSFKKGFQAAQTPEMLMKNPLVNGLIEALDVSRYHWIEGVQMHDIEADRATHPLSKAQEAIEPFKEVR